MVVVRLNSRRFVLILAIAVFFLVFLKLYYVVSHLAENQGPNEPHDINTRALSTDIIQTSDHKLAVLIPFRDRFEELMEFVPHIHGFLNRASISHRIIVLNQADKLRFNRASLINAGYYLSITDCDYLAMHDVDLLPLNEALDYGYPDGYAFHVAAPNLHPLYHYSKFVGGILILRHVDYKKLDGMSNRYWGWGREDDEFYVRMKEAGIEVRRPNPELVTTGNKTFLHIHDRIRRPRDNKRYGNQKASGNKRDRKTGLASLKYNVTEQYSMTINGAPVTVYNLELYCDREDTPWCEVPSEETINL